MRRLKGAAIGIAVAWGIVAVAAFMAWTVGTFGDTAKVLWVFAAFTGGGALLGWTRR